MKITPISRSRWAAVGAAVAVSLGAGGVGISQATTSSGERAIYKPIEPCRLTDTRSAFQVGPRSTPLGANETYTLSGQGAVGNCNLPTGTAALSLNVTATDASAPTFVALFPAGGSLPVASHLNPLPGEGPTPNAVNVDLNAAGEFSIYNLAGNVNIFVDVVGFYDDHNHDDSYYTKDQVDAAIATGGTPGDFYTEDEVDGLLANKANSADVNAALGAKANSADVYTEDEVDGLLANKANSADVNAALAAKANSADVYTQAQVDAMMPFAVQSVDPVTVDLGNSDAGDQQVAEVNVTAPVAGQVTLNYSMWISTPGGARVGCSVGVDATTFEPTMPGSSVGDTARRYTLSGTRVISVAAGTTTTFRVTCDTLDFGTGVTTATHPVLTALYTPSP